MVREIAGGRDGVASMKRGVSVNLGPFLACVVFRRPEGAAGVRSCPDQISPLRPLSGGCQSLVWNCSISKGLF
jgi:hypothetical protein